MLYAVILLSKGWEVSRGINYGERMNDVYVIFEMMENRELLFGN
jgi:hypothetical protein